MTTPHIAPPYLGERLIDRYRMYGYKMVPVDPYKEEYDRRFLGACRNGASAQFKQHNWEKAAYEAMSEDEKKRVDAYNYALFMYDDEGYASMHYHQPMFYDLMCDMAAFDKADLKGNIGEYDRHLKKCIQNTLLYNDTLYGIYKDECKILSDRNMDTVWTYVYTFPFKLSKVFNGYNTKCILDKGYKHLLEDIRNFDKSLLRETPSRDYDQVKMYEVEDDFEHITLTDMELDNGTSS